MATIYELAQMSNDAYNGTSSPTQNIGPGSPLLAGLSSDWTVVATSAALPTNNTNWTDGYFGVVYRNTVTGEIVIANRGTDSNDGWKTLLSNLLSDKGLARGNDTKVQRDAAAFADAAIRKVKGLGYSIPNVIETGHSLGGNEAQAAVIALASEQSLLGNAPVSGVVFNSPGIGGYSLNGTSAASYNVLDIYTQGDAIHSAGGTHLGYQIMIATGPDTTSLLLSAPAGVPGSPIDIEPALGVALYDLIGPAHSINTILPYLASTGGGSAIGSINWTTTNASSVQGAAANSSLPQYSFNAQGNLVITDPASKVTVTMSLSTDGQHLLTTFAGGGGSAVGQALASLGVVSIPISEIGQGLGGLSGASQIYENISRNASGAFDVTFQTTPGPASPASGGQFAVSAAISNAAFDYDVPASGQTVVETIDNGPGNTSGTITVLAGSSSTQLTGGTPVSGEAKD